MADLQKFILDRRDPESPHVDSSANAEIIPASAAMTLRIVVVLLLGVLGCRAAGAVPVWEQPDRSRSGEVVDEEDLQAMRRGIAVFTTVEVAMLDTRRVSTMGQVFQVRPAAIRKFRWGRSMAPAGHRLAETVWYTIWYEDEFGAGLVRLTLRVDREARILETREW